MDFTDQLLEALKKEDYTIKLKDLSNLIQRFCIEKQVYTNDLNESWIESLTDFIILNTRVFYTGCDGKRAWVSMQGVTRYLKKNRKTHTDLTQPYQCNFCERYHLTSKLENENGKRLLLPK